jgi:peptidoglycan/xylan/chitin deacetylase (PgdA/CDA1 family)
MKRDFIINLHGLGDAPRELDSGEERFWLPVNSFEEILDYAATPGRHGRARMALTFDDGNRSDVDIALPRLLARNLSAQFFVVAGRIGAPHFLDTWHLRKLSAVGMTIGMHGFDHVEWRGLSDAALRREIEEARAMIEDVVGGPVLDVAIPYGSYDRRVLRCLRDAGYRGVYTSDGGSCLSAAWVKPRTCVTRDMQASDIEALHASATLAATMLNRVRLFKRGLLPGPPLMPAAHPSPGSESQPQRRAGGNS